jgi:hypothetical protein
MPSPEADELQFVEVSAREFPKMKYLVDTMSLMDAMYQDFKVWREQVAMNQGITVESRIDWRAVANFCAPQVLVVLAHDPGKVSFEDHPRYAVLPESGQFICLDVAISLSVEESEDGKPELDVQGTLNSLLTFAQSIDGGKRDNAVKQVQILKRILK